jgi:hypothetical protein
MPTVLPSLGLTKYIWNMSRFQLIQFLMHIWGLYQALIADYQELQAQNIRLQQIVSASTKRAAEAEKSAAEAEQLAAHAVKRAAEAEERATDAENHVADAEWYVRNVEKQMDEIKRREKAEADIVYELQKDPNFTKATKSNYVKSQTKAVLKAQKELEDYKRSMDAFVKQIVDLLQQHLFDLITQRSTLEFPVIVISSSEQDDPIFMNRGDAHNAKCLSGNKFPMGQGSTIQKIVECASLKNMVESMREVLKLCGCDLSE